MLAGAWRAHAVEHPVAAFGPLRGQQARQPGDLAQDAPEQCRTLNEAINIGEVAGEKHQQLLCPMLLGLSCALRGLALG
eukprot:4507557-Lingulodinium_polyedra.AAC.1